MAAIALRGGSGASSRSSALVHRFDSADSCQRYRRCGGHADAANPVERTFRASCDFSSLLLGIHPADIAAALRAIALGQKRTDALIENDRGRLTQPADGALVVEVGKQIQQLIL